jgi:hypothetical protein
MTDVAISKELGKSPNFLNCKKKASPIEYKLIKFGFQMEQNYSQAEREKMLKNVDFVKGALSSIQL